MVNVEFAACIELLMKQANSPIPLIQRSDPHQFTPQTCRLELFQCNVSFTPPEELRIVKVVPRSYFGLIFEKRPNHSFVFKCPTDTFFHQLAAERNLAVAMLETDDGTWELYLKPSRERESLFGYIAKREEIIEWSQSRVDRLIQDRKLPLVLDIDDTILRLVPEVEARKVPHRMKMINGSSVVLAEGLQEFLEWSSQLYEISICSVGEQSYVDSVVAAIDPKRVLIKGAIYSAREKYEWNQRLNNSSPAKDLCSLFTFCENDSSMPLIIDDNYKVWPPSQQDNIMIVREELDAELWNVDFKPIMAALHFIHRQFFLNPKAKVVDIYKHYLRICFRDKISKRKQ